MTKAETMIVFAAMSSSVATMCLVRLHQSGVLSRLLSHITSGTREERAVEDKKLSYAIIGDSFVDVLAPGVKELPQWNCDSLAERPVALHPGGSALNTAVHIKELCGQSVTLHSAVGNDDFGSFLCAALERRGLAFVNHWPGRLKEGRGSALSNGQSRQEVGTGACLVISGSQDRAFVTHRGVIDKFGIESADAVADGSSHIHIAGYYNCPGLQADVPDLLRIARLAGVTTSLGVQHDATGAWKGIAESPLLVQESNGLVHLNSAPDFLILSEDEARGIVSNSGNDALFRNEAQHGEDVKLVNKADTSYAEEDALFLLSKGAAVLAVVVTIGAEGVIAAARQSPTTSLVVVKQQAASISSETFVDATGAGDAFAAGFIAGIHCTSSSLHQADLGPRSLRRALMLGCAAGAACVANLGASAPLLQANVDAYLRELQQHNAKSVNLPDLVFTFDHLISHE